MATKKKITQPVAGVQTIELPTPVATTVVEELVVVEQPTVVEPPKPEPVEAKAPVRLRQNFITFAQWAKSKGVPARHFAGMKAFLPNPDRSFTSEEWDEIFSKY